MYMMNHVKINLHLPILDKLQAVVTMSAWKFVPLQGFPGSLMVLARPLGDGLLAVTISPYHHIIQ